MTVSVRMDSLLEKELEQAAKRQGMTKSQFVIDAVQAALGRTPSPFELLLKVEQEMAVYRDAEAAKPRKAVRVSASSQDDRLREALRAEHEADLRDWAKYHGLKASNGTAMKKARKTRR
jgi:antitoxin component of RelBE/YafQ-DinJ toxin-antitoxin module